MLDRIQKEAVDHVDGPCLVIAGPGSGKTTVITERIKKLLETNKVSGDRILVITFTKDAALGMKRRFDNLSLSGGTGVHFGTFHSVFFHILMEEEGFKSADLIYGKEKNEYIKRALKVCHVRDYESEETIKNYVNLFGKKINCLNMVKLEEVEERAFSEYQSFKRKHRRLDFDDMLLLTLELFLNKPDILKKWRKRFSYFLVDEVQDMNRLQFRILSLLIYPDNNIFAVGDEDQSIYGFRGSEPKLMLDFPRIFPDAKIIKLENNYRNTNEIIEVAGSLIKNNKNRFNKNIVTLKGEGESVVIKKYDNPVDEMKDFALCMRNIKSESETSAGCGPRFAILYRNNYQGREIEKLLSKDSLKIYKKDLKEDKSDRALNLVKSTFNILCNTFNRMDLLCLIEECRINIPRFLFDSGQVTFEGLIKNASYDSELINRIKRVRESILFASRLKPYPALNFIINTYRPFSRGIGDRDESRDLLDRLLYLKELSRAYKSNVDFKRALLEGELKSVENVPFDDADLALYTFHGSKGLEFDYVFIPDLNESICPSVKCTDDDTLEEERRMLYVALTRARVQLFLGVIGSRNDAKIFPSRFIREMGLSL